MDPVLKKPSVGFRRFIEEAEMNGWITQARWVENESFRLMRMSLGEKKAEGISRTYKRGTDGQWWGLEVQADYGTVVGADMRVFFERPLFDKSTWITERLGISRGTSERQILEDWSVRVAAMKALWAEDPDLKIRIGQFRKNGNGGLTVYSPKGDLSVQTRAMWTGSWLLSMAWKTTGSSAAPTTPPKTTP